MEVRRVASDSDKSMIPEIACCDSITDEQFNFFA